MPLSYCSLVDIVATVPDEPGWLSQPARPDGEGDPDAGGHRLRNLGEAPPPARGLPSSS